MANEPLIIEVGQSSFDRYVIQNSHHLPVLVEFMAVWSEPCIAMATVLERLAHQYAGQFIFAKVDVEQHQPLAINHSVNNAPALKVFVKGEVIFSQEGQLQDDELRTLLKGMGITSESEILREDGRAKHMAGQSSEAILLMSQAIKADPGNTRVAMDMVQIFLDIGEIDQAIGLYNRLPEHERISAMGKSLLGQLTFAELASHTAGAEQLRQQLQLKPQDHDARFDFAICLVASHDLNSAVDQLFTLLRTEPGYKEGAAKEMIITIINMLAPNNPELAAKYRTRLANQLAG